MAAADKALDLTVKAAATGGGKLLGLIRQAASNKVVRTAVTTAGEQAVKDAAGGATTRGSAYLAGRRNDRKHRLLAMDLARQIGGEVSVGTVIDGKRYYVVWRDDEPLQAFPPLPEASGCLAGRPELRGFVGRRVAPPPH